MVGDGGHIVPGCSGVRCIVLAHQHLDAGDSVAVGAVGGRDHVLGRDLGVELETKVAEYYPKLYNHGLKRQLALSHLLA